MRQLITIFLCIFLFSFLGQAQVLPKVVSVTTVKKADCVGMGAIIDVTLSDTLPQPWTTLNVHIGSNTNNSERSGTSTYLGNKVYRISGVNVFPTSNVANFLEAYDGIFYTFFTTNCSVCYYTFSIGKEVLISSSVPKLNICHCGDVVTLQGSLPGTPPYYASSARKQSGCSYSGSYPNSALNWHRSSKSLSSTNLLLDLKCPKDQKVALFDSTGCPIFSGACQLSTSPYYNTIMENSWDIKTTGKAPVTALDTVEFCPGDSVLVNNKYYKVSTLVMDTVKSNNIICTDTIKTTVVQQRSNKKVQVDTSICSGMIYTFPNGDTATISKTNISVAPHQCLAIQDSIITQLTVHPTFWVPSNDSICVGNTYTFPDGDSLVILQSMTDTSYLFSQYGCDSIIETQVKALASVVLNKKDTICQGKSYLFPNGKSSSVSTIDTSSVINSSGCFDTQITQLQVNPPLPMTVFDSICSGKSYTFPDGDQSNVSTIDTSFIQSPGTCDSLIITQLTVFPPQHYTHQNARICSGQVFTFPDGDTSSRATVDTSVVTSSQTCDSAIVTFLGVIPNYNRVEKRRICAGAVYTFPNGDTASISKIHQSIFTNVWGCDSIIETQLTVMPAYHRYDSASICQGGTYTLPNGNVVTSSGIYSSLLSTSLGCDSIIETTVTVSPNFHTTLQASICQGDIYTFPKGNTSQTNTTDSAHFQSQNGCDSIIITHLSVIPLDTSVTQNGATLTANESSANSYQWIDCRSGKAIPGAQSKQYQATVNGLYAVALDRNNCLDTSSCFLIETVGMSSYGTDQNIKLYPNPTSGKVHLKWSAQAKKIEVFIQNSLGQVVWKKEYVNTDFIEMQFNNLPEGVYLLNATDGKTSRAFQLHLQPGKN